MFPWQTYHGRTMTTNKLCLRRVCDLIKIHYVDIWWIAEFISTNYFTKNSKCGHQLDACFTAKVATEIFKLLLLMFPSGWLLTTVLGPYVILIASFLLLNRGWVLNSLNVEKNKGEQTIIGQISLRYNRFNCQPVTVTWKQNENWRLHQLMEVRVGVWQWIWMSAEETMRVNAWILACQPKWWSITHAKANGVCAFVLLFIFLIRYIRNLYSKRKFCILSCVSLGLQNPSLNIHVTYSDVQSGTLWIWQASGKI